MAPFLDSRWYTSTNVAALYAAAGGAPATTPAQDLVDTWASGGAGSDGFAMVFEDSAGTDAPSIYVKDSGTPANDTDINLTDDFDAFNSFLTYTSPSPKIVRQSDGDLKYRAHNLITQSNSFSTTWSAAGTGALTSGQADPDGGSNAWLFTCTADGDRKLVNSVAAPVSTECKFSVIAKYVAGNGLFRLYAAYAGGSAPSVSFDIQNGTVSLESNTTGSIESLGDGWYKCSMLYTSDFAAARERWIELQDANSSTTADNGDQIYIYKAHDHFYPADETYLPTTSAASYALPIQHDSSNNAEGLLVEPAATNLVTYSNDLTNAAWTKANMTTAKTATGPGGASNEATTCTATAGNATALFSITSASAARVTSAYIKRRTGTGNIDLTQNNGSTWTTVAVDSNWTRFDIGPATAANPIVGIRIVTSGDAVDVALFQHELGSVPTSPIITTGATATRAADDLNKALTAIEHSATAGTLYVKYVPRGVATSRDIVRLDDGTANEVISIGQTSGAAARLTVTDGGAAQTAPLTSGTVVAAADNKVAASWAANDFAISEGGAAASTDTSGTLPTVTTFDVGAVNGLVKEVLHLPEAMSDGDLASITT